MLQAQQVLQERYQLKQQLGQNPGRQTWLAQDVKVSPAESVILKLLAFNPQMQWDEFKLFEREAQVLKQLNHPRIPRYRDYFSLDQQVGAGLYWFGLVQDHIPGTSLRQLLDQGQRFTEAQVQSIATDILEILIYLHGLNPPVIHRDIKPSNLILGDDGRVYLVDFGAVQDTAAAEGVTFTVVGTTGYTPLEQFWGRTVPASDLYALGATLIHLLTGTAPADLPQQDLRIQFRDRISINPSLTRWIETLTEPDLEQRFTDASEALEALQTERYPKSTLNSIITQPAGSQVQIQKSRQQLAIKIPRHKRSLPDLLRLGGNLILTVCSLPFVLLLALLIFVLVIGLLVSLLLSNLLFFAFLLFAVLLGWSGMATSQELSKVKDEIDHSLRNLFGHHCLYFDRQYFVIEQQLFGLSYLRHVGEISDIKRVKQIPFQELSIHTRKINHSFADELTESERNWLFQEIQDWLNQRN
jgi:serine/threonine protein kinase